MADSRAGRVLNFLLCRLWCDAIFLMSFFFFSVFISCRSTCDFWTFFLLQKKTSSPVSWTSVGKRCRRRASSWRWEGVRGCDGGLLSAPGPSGGWRKTHRERIIKTVLKPTCKSASFRSLAWLWKENRLPGAFYKARHPSFPSTGDFWLKH